MFGKKGGGSRLCGLLIPECSAENSVRKAGFSPSAFAKYNCSSIAREKRQPCKHADPNH